MDRSRGVIGMGEKCIGIYEESCLEEGYSSSQHHKDFHREHWYSWYFEYFSLCCEVHGNKRSRCSKSYLRSRKAPKLAHILNKIVTATVQILASWLNYFRYIYSFYVATKMATSIGNLPHATNCPEFIFMTVYWLTGVYVSAILIGQVIVHTDQLMISHR